MNSSDLRTAAQAIVEQLKHGWVSESDPVAVDLRTALAQQAEPVAEVHRLRNTISRACCALSAAEEEDDWPMYAAQVDAVRQMLDAAIKAAEENQ